MTKTNQMKRILQYYSVVLVIVITVFAVLICFVQIVSNVREARSTLNLGTNQLTNFFSMNETTALTIATELTNSNKRRMDTTNYFTLDFQAYLAGTLGQISDETVGDDYVYLPGFSLNKVFYANDNVVDFSISLNNFDEKFYADLANKLGRKVLAIPENPDAVRLYSSLVDVNTNENIGTIHLGLNREDIDTKVQALSKEFNMDAIVISSTGQLLYQSNQGSTDLTKQLKSNLTQNSEVDLKELSQHFYFNDALTNQGMQVITVISKRSVMVDSIRLLGSFVVASLVIAGILVSVLFFLFTRYDKQVKEIVAGIKGIGEGGLGKRIPETDQKGELKEITIGINQMLDRINLYIEAIYKLEIKQKDAHMRALQSQINPHFLYNTLEYIRMYAVSIGAEELSEVVFSFASLMRNNISQETQSTIRNELEFCEKYVYLYQMRYPNKIAYYFNVEEGLEELILPKFSIQPLVENYFVHGIDYTRQDNAIRVKAYSNQGQGTIEIVDNGKGMTELAIAKLTADLCQPTGQVSQSIGISNVNERLGAHLGPTYHLAVSQTKGGGLTIKLSFSLGQEAQEHV